VKSHLAQSDDLHPYSVNDFIATLAIGTAKCTWKH